MKYEDLKIVSFIIDNEKYFSIWYEADKIGFIKDARKLLVFKSREEAQAYIDKNLNYQDKIGSETFNINGIRSYLGRDLKKLKGEEILDFWNISLDLSQSLGLKFRGQLRGGKINSVYDKLFFSENMDLINPLGNNYRPDFSQDEELIIREVIRDGLDLVGQVF